MSSDGTTAKLEADRARRLAVLGYITAVAMPPIGFVVGVVLATRHGKSFAKHGLTIIVVSLIAAIVWILLLTSGALTSTTNETGY